MNQTSLLTHSIDLSTQELSKAQGTRKCIKKSTYILQCNKTATFCLEYCIQFSVFHTKWNNHRQEENQVWSGLTWGTRIVFIASFRVAQDQVRRDKKGAGSRQIWKLSGATQRMMHSSKQSASKDDKKIKYLRINTRKMATSSCLAQ